ncbi:MAG: hypothetical protein JST81_10350 [Bacteroidetes bacterium]|nr:hypothetical protein [Bacteroidota bacterium]
MNENTRYEKDLVKQLQDISLPDKNDDWELMKKMLDEDDNTPAVPVMFNRLNRTLLFFALLISIAGSTWYFTYYSSKAAQNIAGKSASSKNTNQEVDYSAYSTDITKNGTKTSPSSSIQINSQPGGNNISSVKKITRPASVEKNPKRINNSGIQSFNEKLAINTGIGNETATANFTKKRKKITDKGRKNVHYTNPGTETVQQENTTGTESRTPAHENKFNKKTIAQIPDISRNKHQLFAENNTVPSVNTDRGNTALSTIAINEEDSLGSTNAKGDSLLSIKQVTAGLNPTVHSVNNKKKEHKKKQFVGFAFGIGEQQSFRLSQHYNYPGNSYGFKFRLRDYIPSVYLRYYTSHWFGHVGFKYAAPVFVNQFLYERNVDAAPFNYTSKLYILKHVYANELSASYHRIVLPRFAAGAGVKYSFVHSGTTQVDYTRKRYGIRADSLISTSFVSTKSGAGYIRFLNTVHFDLDLQYQFKKLSVGATYSIALSPYVNYEDPLTLVASKKKTNAFRIFLYYDLWRRKN